MGQLIYGQLSQNAFGVDDVYVVVNPPQPVLVGGGNTNQGGLAGGAGWGPKNTPVTCGTPQELMQNFGTPINSGFDLVQEGSLFLKQLPRGGVKAVRVVHATTDAAASGTLLDTAPATGLTLTGKYTGSYGNTIQVFLGKGSNYQTGTKTWKVVIQPGVPNLPEVYDRISDGAGSGALWQNIADAINNGQAGYTQPSQYVTAAIAASALEAPTVGQTITLTGGLDGATGITSADLIGVDGGAGARTGAYALRETGVNAMWLCGNSDSTVWTTLQALAQSEKSIAFCSLPEGTGVATAVSAILAAGLNSPWAVLLKDYVTYFDSFVGGNVQVPPASVAAGIMCRLAAHQSPGNNQAYALVGTEATLGTAPQPYSFDDLSALEQAGINLIAIPIPGARAFGLRHGKSTSTNPATSEITYANMTNFLTSAFVSEVMGQFVNLNQSTRQDDPTRESVTAAMNGFLGGLLANRQIDDFSVQCDLNNNPPNSIAAGFLICTVIIKYLAVIDKFVINMTAGQTVVTNTGAQPAR